MAAPLFTSLQAVKDWLNTSPGSFNDDIVLQGQIAQASNFITSRLSRGNLFYQQYSEVYDGRGQTSFMLKNYPVWAITSLTDNNVPIPPLNGCNGYQLDAWDGNLPGQMQRVLYRGGRFCLEPGAISVTYNAGYAVLNEANTIPAAGNLLQPLAAMGSWGADIGITKAGIAMAKVATAPATGQYTCTSDGTYGFAAADAGQAILMSYSYIPPAIEQACLEIIGERFAAKGRIGQVSHSQGGQETVSFSQKKFHDYIDAILQPYMRVGFAS